MNGGVIDQKTDTGRMKISSPELTALDLLRYARAAGTFDSIATLLPDLGRKLKPEALAGSRPPSSAPSSNGSATCWTMSSSPRPPPSCTLNCKSPAAAVDRA